LASKISDIFFSGRVAFFLRLESVEISRRENRIGIDRLGLIVKKFNAAFCQNGDVQNRFKIRFESSDGESVTGGSMGIERSAKNLKSVPSGSAEGAEDEINQIMQEIEDLQEGMAQAVQPGGNASSGPTLKAVPTPPPAPMAAESSDGMAEFRGSSEEPSMEETLANLKPDEDSEELAPAVEASSEETAESSEEEEAESEETEEEGSETTEDSSSDSESEEEEEEESMASAREESDEGMEEQESDSGSSSHTNGPGQDSLTMMLTGNMTLKLRYEFEGQEIILGFQDHALKVQLSDGTEFKIPLARRTLKAA
jgi:hypothetical protein